MKKTTITANGKEKVVYNYSPEILYSLYDLSGDLITENEDEQDLWIDACEIYTNADSFTPENYIEVLEEHEPDEKVERYKELHALTNPTEEERAEEHDLWDYIVERAELYPETLVKTLDETILVEWENILPEGTEKTPEEYEWKKTILCQPDGDWKLYRERREDDACIRLASKEGEPFLLAKGNAVYAKFTLEKDKITSGLIPSFTEDDLVASLEDKDIAWCEAQEVVEELINEMWKLISNIESNHAWNMGSTAVPAFKCSACGYENDDLVPGGR